MDLQLAERNVLVYETRCNDLQSQYNQSQAERKKLVERERELEQEVEKLKALLEDARKHLGEETLHRVVLENSIQSLKEDISFKDQIHQQELTETRTKRQVCISKYRNKDNHCDIYLMNFNYCVLMIKLMYIVTIIYLISILD